MFARPLRQLIATASLLWLSLPASGAIINFTDAASYFAATGAQITIDFTDTATGTALTNEYAAQGVSFNGAERVTDGAFLVDGEGIRGTLPGAGVFDFHFELTFASLINSLAFDFPGALTMELYDGATLVGTSADFGLSGAGFFGGILSDVGFNRAVIYDHCCAAVFADNIFTFPKELAPSGQAPLFSTRASATQRSARLGGSRSIPGPQPGRCRCRG